jgi:hypothetical protein
MLTNQFEDLKHVYLKHVVSELLDFVYLTDLELIGHNITEASLEGHIIILDSSPSRPFV